MTKKEKENIKKWRLHFINEAIAAILRKDETENVLAHYNPSFIGYLVAALHLLKLALSHEDKGHFIVIK